MAGQHTLDELQGHFEIEGVVRFDAGAGGLTRAVVTAAAGEAHVYLHGAHVTHFQPRGERPVLFLGRNSQFALNQPIRGGVPVIFPWFGQRGDNPAAPLHGFARLLEWGLEAVEQRSDGAVTLMFNLASHDATLAQWPHDFELRYQVTIGSRLELQLEVRNAGAQPLRFEEALHTYLSVGDVRQVRVDGLQGAEYLDKTRGMQRFRQDDQPLKLTVQTDRVYLDTRATCIVEDIANGRRIVVAKENSDATVVWNPWGQKQMPDLGTDEWPFMLCVETANVGQHAVELPGGEAHSMSARISVER